MRVLLLAESPPDLNLWRVRGPFSPLRPIETGLTLSYSNYLSRCLAATSSLCVALTGAYQ